MGRQIRIPLDLKKSLLACGIDPSDLVLYINSACNLRCKHCYIGNSLLNASESYCGADIINFIIEFGHLDRLTILGGEPLLHRDINAIVDNISSDRITSCRITTNLTSLSGFDYVRHGNKNLVISVSVDGHSEQLHDHIRGPGTFRATIKNLRLLLSAGYEVELTHTIMRHNIGHFPAMLQLCRQLGVQKLNLHRISLHGNAILNSDLYVSPTEWVSFCQTLKDKAATVDDVGGDSICVRYPPLFTTGAKFRNMISSGEYHHHTSGSFYGDKGRIVLYPDGKLYISSEAFSTESYIGCLDSEGFHFNNSPRNEFIMFTNDEAKIETMNPNQSGDKNYPAVLSVSYKKSLIL